MEDVSRDIDSIWIGANYHQKRVLVLGESWYGNYLDNSDRGFVSNYLSGAEKDSMYTRMANACMPNILSREDRLKTYWNSIAFTNFVGRVGDERQDRPTSEDYRNSQARLEKILLKYEIRLVWILGIEQAQFSKPIIKSAGLRYEVTAHPTSYGLTNAKLGASWSKLLASQDPSQP